MVDKVDKKAAVIDVAGSGETPGSERADREDESPRGGAAPTDPRIIISARNR